MVTGSNWLRLGAAAAIALAAAAPARAKDAPATFAAQSSASETGTGEDAVQHTVNTSFAFDHIYARGTDQSRFMLYEQRIASEQPLNAEGPMSELTVTARSRGAQGYGEVLWTIHDNGNAGEAMGDYYRTTLYGCCGGENVYRSYLAWTGKLAFTATADPIFAEIPNTPTRRAFAWLSANAMDGFDRERFPQGAGMVAIVDGDKTIDRVLFEATDEGSDFGFTPKLTFVDPTGAHAMNGDEFDLWAADGNPDPAGVTGIELVADWDWQAGAVAKLPLVAGRFDLEHAVLPQGLTVRRLPTE
jgi:hypothetical protein